MVSENMHMYTCMHSLNYTKTLQTLCACVRACVCACVWRACVCACVWRACVCACMCVCTRVLTLCSNVYNRNKQNKPKENLLNPHIFSSKVCVTHTKLLGVGGSYNAIPLHMLWWKLLKTVL